MARLPVVGGDDGNWGSLLNTFLEVSLDNTNADQGERGKLKPAAVDAAGAVMNTDTSTATMSFVVDEDNMASNSATKVPTQQSVKAYVDTSTAGLATDASVVKLTGNQTVGGQKTFTNPTTFNDVITGVAAGAPATDASFVMGAGDDSAVAYFLSDSSADPDLMIGTMSGTGMIGLGSDGNGVDTAITHTGFNHLTLSDIGGGGSNHIRLSNVADPTAAQDAVTKNYLDSNLMNAGRPGSAAYRSANMDTWFAALGQAHTTPANIVWIGDSLSSLASLGKPMPWGVLQQIQENNPRGYRNANPAFNTPGEVDVETNGSPTATGVAGQSVTLDPNEYVRFVNDFEGSGGGVSVVYKQESGAGTLSVRWNGSEIATINASGTTTYSKVWTSGPLGLSFGTNLEVVAQGAAVTVEGLYRHQGSDLTKGVRVWPATRSGATSTDFATTYPDQALALIKELNPQLVVVATGTNDSTGVAATTKAAVGSLVTAIRAVPGFTGDVALWIPYLNTQFTVSEAAALRELVEEEDLGVIDAATALGFAATADTVHPTRLTSEQMAAHAAMVISGDPLSTLAKRAGWESEFRKWIETGNTTGIMNLFNTGANSIVRGQTWLPGTGSIKVGGFTGLQLSLNASDANVQAIMATSDVMSLAGFSGAGIVLGAGGASAVDTGLTRYSAKQLSINEGTGTLVSNLAPVINAQTGTSYTLVLNDAGKQITRNNSSASTQTLPQNSDAAIPVGAQIKVLNIGTGTVTLQAGTGATLVGDTSLSTNQVATVIKISTNGWLASVDSTSTTAMAGPASATDNAIVRFDNTTGKLTQNSSVLVSDTGALRFDVSSGAKTYYRTAMIRDASATVTGTLKIVLPFSWTGTMLRMTIKGYNYKFNESAWDLTVAGYTYATTPEWFNYHAVASGRTPFTSVRLAHDGTNCVVLLGVTSTVWNYPTVEISEVIATGSQTSGWDGTWSMSFVTSETGITNIVTPTLNKIAATSSASATDNAIVLFDGTSGSVIKDSTKLLPSGTIVGTSDTQTLTSKTLTSPVINTGVSGTAIDTDGTLAANSDTKLASQKAVKTYADTLGAGYAVLAGKSGGQTLNGGTGSGDYLYLRSTTHATKGIISIGSTPSTKVIIGGTAMPANAAASFGINANDTFTSGGTQVGTDAQSKPTFSTTAGGSWLGADFTAVPVAMVNMANITGIQMQAGPSGASTGTITEAIGVNAFGTNGTGTATVTTAISVKANTGSFLGPVTDSIGVKVQNGQYGGTTTNTTGLYIDSLPGSTSKIGIDVVGQSSATTNIGVRIAKSNTYSLQLSSTAGDAASGITFGTDTNLYRSAADTLKTDDKLLIAGELELDGALNHDGSTVGFFGATPVSQSAGWSVNNEATLKSYDANATSINEMADVLGTLIEYLKTTGILGG